MPQSVASYPWYAFNRGIIDPRALARVDLKKLALAAETQDNWMPSRLGSMSLRAGLGYLGTTNNNNRTKHIPFVFSTNDTAIIEVSDSAIRVLVNDTPITRASVSTAVTNGSFTSDLTGWTDADEAGATSAWATGSYMSLIGTDTARAIRTQTLTVASAGQNVEHALRLVVSVGPVTLRVGSTSGGDEYIAQTDLGVGTHSLAFTPTGASAYVQISGIKQYAALLKSINIESSGVMSLTGPWTDSDLFDATGNCLLRSWESADVTYITVPNFQQRKIERRSTTSWSIVLFQPVDGPFRLENTSTLTLTASALNGDITLTASAKLFNATQVGALFQISSVGQNVTKTISAQNTFTNKIEVTGVSTGRAFTIVITGLSGTSSTVTLQRSFDEGATWADVSAESWTADVTTSYTDGLDNQTAYYQLGVKTGDYSSGTIVASMQTGEGSITGVVRISAFSSATSVSAIVLSSLGGTSATDVWSEGEWSDYRGWPTAVSIYEGRETYAGKSKIMLSVSDAYESYDPNTTGDSGPIDRTIGSGPIDTINWLAPVQRLLAGGQGGVFEIKSDAIDSVITPTNFNIKEPITLSTAPVDPVKIDTRILCVHGDNKSVFELKFDQVFTYYTPSELTELVPNILSPACLRTDVQRRPDTRVHFVRSDGVCVVFLYDPDQDLRCAITVTTDGIIEEVFVMPGQPEERVYYVVKRTINGSAVRYLEKWALETEIVGGTTNKQADSFKTFTNGTATNSIPAGTCSHLVGKSVIVWADGLCLSDSSGNIATFTVQADGSVTGLTHNGTAYNATTGVVGLPYTAPFKSGKLFQVARGSALTMLKSIRHLGLILYNTHAQGIKYGTDFSHLDNLPQLEKGKVVDLDSIWSELDTGGIKINDTGDTDLRLCLQAQAPRPCTVTAAVIGIETEEIA